MPGVVDMAEGSPGAVQNPLVWCISAARRFMYLVPHVQPHSEVQGADALRRWLHAEPPCQHSSEHCGQQYTRWPL